jgi:hypothetical protein
MMTDVTDITGAWLSSPTTARRWLGREMRHLRTAAGVAPKVAADALRSSVAKVAYTESGEHSFKPRDLTEVLLPLYRVPEGDWGPLLAACRAARGRGWWSSYDSESLPDWVRRYVGLEQGASSLASWEALYPHGLLQERSYAEALMRNAFARLDDDEVEARIELRLHRQEVLRRRPDPLRAHFVLDEAILRRVVGGPDVMEAQLRHIAEANEQPNVTVQVVPFTHGPHPEAAGAFSLLGFGRDGAADGEDDDRGVVYLEGRADAEYLEGPAEVEDHQVVFSQLTQLALSPDESTSLVHAIAKEHRTR